MLKRPKSGDDEEDILRMQEQFLREKSKNQNLQPAASFVNLRETKPTTIKQISSESCVRKPSKYALTKGLQSHEKRIRFEEPTTSLVGDIVEKNVNKTEEPDDDDDKVYYPKILPSVLGNIVEKNQNNHCTKNTLKMPLQGFPAVLKHDVNKKDGSSSIFASHMTKLEKDNVMITQSIMDIDTPCSSNTVISKSTYSQTLLNIPQQSYLVNSSDAESIHKENVEVLNKMSEKDILEEQKKLLENLDPNLIAFLKSKRKGIFENNDQPMKKLENSIIETKMDTTVQQDAIEKNIDDILWDNDVFSHPQINKWLHFDSLEEDKLAWMRGIKENKKINPDQPYEARFNFKGYLMPYVIDYTEENKSLFHHGEEPYRPGYSLNELFELTRSTVTQQRVMALNTLAGILEYYIAGTYKNVIELPLSKILFVIRFTLDENKPIILEPALRAMRNLLYNRIDEASLDALLGLEHGLQQPCLENDKSEIEEIDANESELKDFHLAEIDIVTAVLRTDIIQRIHYILEYLKPSFNSVQYSLQILTRLVRDSLDTARTITETDYLMRTIITCFIPVTSVNFAFNPQIVYNKPIAAALKFLRVLSSQSREIGQLLLNKYDILRPLSEYISSTVDGTYGLRIQTEAICILSNLLMYDIGVENVISVLPLIVTALYKHVQGTNLFIDSSIPSVTHAAVVLQFINRVLNTDSLLIENFKTQLYPLILDGVRKWMTQLSQMDAFTCAHLCLLCSAIDCFTTMLQREKQFESQLSETLKLLANSKGFELVLNQLTPSSNLLSNIDNKQLHQIKNLMSLGTSVVGRNQNILPILSVTSPFTFLLSLCKLLECINLPELSVIYLHKLRIYLNGIMTRTLTLFDNWFTRIETDFIFTTIKIANAGVNINETEKDMLYTVANKLCYIMRIDKKVELEFLFNNIVFNKAWFTTDRLMSLISVSDADIFSKTSTSIDEIKRCYSGVINLNYKDVGPNVVLRKWQEPILPRDWIYLPILNLYSRNQDIKQTSNVLNDNERQVKLLEAREKEFIISCSLEWIIFNEEYFPELLSDIEITDRFCRIMCIFLCDNSLFLDNKIKILLRYCIQRLFKKESGSFNFNKSLVGLNNFQDFYTQFLEQFQSVSYGDFNFAACVLVPLAQKHDVKWRKLLWSEYAGCLRALDCPVEYLCYPLEEYLYPDETDESLLKSYFRALNGNLLRPNTIVHRIASHHVERYKNRTSEHSLHTEMDS